MYPCTIRLACRSMYTEVVVDEDDCDEHPLFSWLRISVWENRRERKGHRVRVQGAGWPGKGAQVCRSSAVAALHMV